MTMKRLIQTSCIALLGLLTLPTLALAQDSDNDGIADNADTFPCDPSRASVSYFPTATGAAMLAYEDQWPGDTDLDYNDVVALVHYRLERNASGDVVMLHASFDPVALGGIYSNGLALQLPTSKVGVTARRRIAGGAWSPVAMQAADSNVVMVLSQNLRELYGDLAGKINSDPNSAIVNGSRLELEVTFATPAALASNEAPFDPFIFRTGDFSHQIHFPQYAGTQAMNGALFNSNQDASTPSRRFVHLSGTPAALNLLGGSYYPIEGVAVSALFPDITGFASSGGANNQNFYATNVVPASGHSVASKLSATVPPAMATPDTACTQATGLQTGVSNYSDVIPANGDYGIQEVRFQSATVSGNTARIHWPLVFLQNASFTGGGTPTNGHWHGLHSGCGNVNGVATCRAVCSSLDATYSAVNTNCSTNYPTVGFSNVTGRNLYMTNSGGNPSGPWNTYTPNPATGNGNNMEFCECTGTFNTGGSTGGGTTGGGTPTGPLSPGVADYGVTVAANGTHGIQEVRYQSVVQTSGQTTIYWPLVFLQNASFTGGGTPTNGHWHGLHSGCGNINGVATCTSVCTSLNMSYVAVNSNCSTNYPTTGFSNVTGRNLYMSNSSGNPSGVWNTYTPNPATGNGNNMEWCRCQ